MSHVERMHVNLAARPFTNDTLAWLLVGVLAAAGLGLTVWNVSLFVSVNSQIADLSSQRTALAARERAASQEQGRLLAEAQRTLKQAGTSRASFANTILRQWAFSWTGLFNQLEAVIPYGVRLRSIRPRFDDGVHVRLGGISRDNESFWNFQQALLDAGAFGDVYPDAVQASDVRLSLGRGEQLFSLDMEYFPAAEPELAQVNNPAVRAVSSGQATPSAAPAGVTGPAGVASRPGEGMPSSTPDAPATVPVGTASPRVARPSVAAERSSPGDRPTIDGAQAPVAGQPPAGRARGRPARRANRPTRAQGGVKRATPFPAGSPLAPVPQMGSGDGPAKRRSGMDLSDYTLQPDGSMVDRDGNRVTLDEVMKMPGQIHPLRRGELPPLTPPDQVDNPDGEAAPPSDSQPADGSTPRRTPRGKKR